MCLLHSLLMTFVLELACLSKALIAFMWHVCSSILMCDYNAKLCFCWYCLKGSSSQKLTLEWFNLETKIYTNSSQSFFYFGNICRLVRTFAYSPKWVPPALSGMGTAVLIRPVAGTPVEKPGSLTEEASALWSDISSQFLSPSNLRYVVGGEEGVQAFSIKFMVTVIFYGQVEC